MKKIPISRWLTLFLLFAFVFNACSTSMQAPTATISPTQTYAPTETVTPKPTATATEPMITVDTSKGLKIAYPDLSIIKDAYEKFSLQNPISSDSLRYDSPIPDLLNQDQPNIVFARDPTTGKIILATRYNLETKSLEWDIVAPRDLGDALGIEIGVALAPTDTGKPDIIRDNQAEQIIAEQFNQVTAELFNWQYWEPKQGQTDPNYINWGQGLISQWNAEGLNIRGHALLLPDKNPNWLKSLSNDELKKAIYDHVYNVVSNNKDIKEWNVVNEPYLEAPQYNYARSDIAYEKLGDDAYIIAFDAARDANPTAILLFNDTLNHASTGKGSMTTERTRQLIQAIHSAEKTSGKKLVDGVGMQMHIDANELLAEEDITNTMKSYGLPIYLTEIDVDISSVSTSDPQRFQKQADIYRMIIQAALKSGACKSLTFWAIGDKYSWLELYQNLPNSNPTLMNDF